jgi:hypothetical protein
LAIWKYGNFKNLRGNAIKIEIQLFSGVVVGVVGGLKMAGKTALSRNGTGKKSAECNGVIFLPVEWRGASRLRVAHRPAAWSSPQR